MQKVTFFALLHFNLNEIKFFINTDGKWKLNYISLKSKATFVLKFNTISLSKNRQKITETSVKH